MSSSPPTSAAAPPSYTYQDYLHSTVSASNGSSVEYTPYGLVKASSGILPTDRQFQGQQDQAGVGLYHMGDRWYDPAIGLWTQPDSLVPNPLDPLALNRFSFVEGNPLRFMDPTGHANCDIQCDHGGGGSAVAGGAAGGAVVSLFLGLVQAVTHAASQASSAANNAVSSLTNGEATTPGGVDPEDPLGPANYEQIHQGLERLRRTFEDPNRPMSYRLGAYERYEQALEWERQGLLQGVEVTEGDARYDITLRTKDDVVESGGT